MCLEFLTNDELAELQKVFNEACLELGLSNSPEDQARREHLATMLVTLIDGGDPVSLDALRKHTVFQMQHPNEGYTHAYTQRLPFAVDERVRKG